MDPAGSDAENNNLLQEGKEGKAGSDAAIADAGTSEEVESEAESSVPEETG